MNKLCATDSCISSGLINKVHSIYISVPWLRFTHVDFALTERVLFHRFQLIFNWILLPFSVAIKTIKINNCNQIQPGNYSCFHS